MQRLPCLWINRMSMVKMVILSKAIYKLNAIPIEISMTSFFEIKQILKFK
jgi:hypothetical protein